MPRAETARLERIAGSITTTSLLRPDMPLQPTLRPCPACDHLVSTEAYSCPSCGHPLRDVRCAACGQPIAPASSSTGPDSSRFGHELTPVSAIELNKRASIFKIALEEAAQDRGSLRDPRDRLRRKWAEVREQLKKQVAPAALTEHERYSSQERVERHSQQAWVHPEARLLYANLLQLKTRASEAGAVVDAWFASADFDPYVQDFLAGRAKAEDLLAEARRRQKSAR